MKQGDILVHKNGDRSKVLGTCGEVIFISRANNFTSVSSSNWSEFELKENGWSVEEPAWEPEDGEDFFFIDSWGDIECMNYKLGSLDENIKGFMGIFQTKEQAQKRLEEIKSLINSK